MNVTVTSAPVRGRVRVPSSKSQLHRLLIAAALGRAPVTIDYYGLSADIRATADCLRALGAGVVVSDSAITVSPIVRTPDGLCRLPCGESGSTLRFLLPLCGALGAEAVFQMEGRLPERPLAPLDAQLRLHGMQITRRGAELLVSGRLSGGEFTLPGNVSSQYLTGLLLSLPLLPEAGTLRVSGPLESAPYVAMTEDTLRLSGVRAERLADGWRISGAQRFALPARLSAEGDWSSAAALLCMGALSPDGVRVDGLCADSSQGDRAIAQLLRKFGAEIVQGAQSLSVRRGALHGIRVDASQIPDLVPVLAALAACADGTTEIVNAARLRLKESDRLRTTAAVLSALGADVRELPDGLVIHGRARLSGGTVDSCGDHRIAMAAAVAACACTEPVVITGAQAVEKSYPRFWADLEALKGGAL